MWKYGNQNHFQQSTRILRLCIQWKTAKTGMGNCKCVWPKSWNIFVKYRIVPYQNVCFLNDNLENI